MIEYRIPIRNRTPIRWVILLLGTVLLGNSGCSLAPKDPIVFSNSTWKSPAAHAINNPDQDRIIVDRAEQYPSPVAESDAGQSFKASYEEPGRNEGVAQPDIDRIVSTTVDSERKTGVSSTSASSPRQRATMFEVMRSDQLHFYSRQNLRPAIRTLGAAAILANTTMDQEFADWYQDDVRSSSLDDIANVAKSFGEQWPMVGAYVGASIGGRLIGEDTRLAYWGERSLRSMFVGVPPLLFLQKSLGSSRPNDRPPSSSWNFWNDDNGASGHTFVGAVPFLVAAGLAEDRRTKATWIALSTLTGWSRINDNDHYLSQVIVGWWLAYASTQSVERSDVSLNYEIAPVVFGDSAGMELIWRR